MFSLATGIYQSYFAPPKLSIVILGLDGSGKTALLERIKVTEINNDNNTGDASSSNLFVPSMYVKGGAAVAGVVGGGLDESIQHKFAKHGSGGRAARLPPPLSPKQALESRQLVDHMLNEGFFNHYDDNGMMEESVSDVRRSVGFAANAAAASTTRLALGQICPPPLVPILEKDGIVHRSSSSDVTNNQMIKSTSVLTRQKASGTKSIQSTLPPPSSSSSLSSSATSSGEKSITSKIPTIVQHKKNTFVGLLRCPSPMKYSNAVDDDDYEEQPLDDAHLEESSWNTEHLRDYYINYQEEEEFDVKKTRAGNAAGGGGVGASQLKKMFPLDRIRPTLGQNLATLDMRGCKCSIFDLSGAVR